MRTNLRLFALSVLFACNAAHGAELELVQMPETTVIAVAPASNSPSAYAAAFGKLVGFYAQANHTFNPVFPQMSLSLNGLSYSAIAITGTPQTEPGIDILVLPSCLFAHEKYVGNYPGLAPAVDALIKAGLSQGLAVARGCGVRVLHVNSPDDTPVEKLVHEIYVPFTRRP